MTTAPDPLEFERSRAAVAFACLEWLRCTGPAIELDADRATSLAADFPRDRPASQPRDAGPGDRPHPLWDRWLDG